MKTYLTIALVFVCLIFLAGEASAVSDTEIHIEDGDAEMVTEFELNAPDEPLNFWEVSVDVPEGTSVVSIEDSLGEIQDYELSEGELSFETNTGVARDSETVRMEYVVEGVVTEEYGGLEVAEFGVFGFRGADAATRARVTVDATIFTVSSGNGFETTLTREEALVEGAGSTTVTVTVGDAEGRYENYAVFEDGTDVSADVSESDSLYDTVPAVFGFEPSVNKHPIVVLPDEEYDEAVNEWSQGQYSSSGVIAVRESVFEDGGATKTVLHETTHAYNDEALGWTDAEVGWFEEGTAGYVEFVADRRRGEPRRSVFGEKRRVEKDGKLRVLGPRGSFEDLRRYYETGSRLMRTWAPEDGEQRRFGYAFSELVVRSYVAEEGTDALHETYEQLLSTEARTSTREGATAVVLEAMNADPEVLRPCSAPTDEETQDCVREINRMDAVVPEHNGFGSETFGFDEEMYVNDGENAGDDDAGVADGERGEDDTGTAGDGTEETPDEAGDGEKNESEGNGVLAVILDAVRRFFEFLRSLVPVEASLR